MQFQRQMLVGNWYRTERKENGEIHTEYAQMDSDGSYEFSFTIQNNAGELIEQSIELGDWGLVGDIHFTIAKGEVLDGEQFVMDMADENNYHAYKVLELDGQTFKYQHIVSEEVFILKRVIDKIAHC